MQSVIVIVFITILSEARRAHAAVDCNAAGRGRFIDPDDPTCTKFSLCIYNPTNCQYNSYDYTCPTYTIFDPAVSICTAVTNFVCKSKPPVCTDEGFFPDPDSTDCTSYVLCISDGSGAFTTDVYTCPGGTVFEPTTAICEYNYKCPKKFSCSANGYVANSDDKTCQSYYYCSSLTNGKYVSYKYKCPGIWKFHPTFKVCTPNYICPK